MGKPAKVGRIIFPFAAWSWEESGGFCLLTRIFPNRESVHRRTITSIFESSFARLDSGGRLSPRILGQGQRTRVSALHRSVEFQGDELGWLVAYVGQGVSVASGQPLHVAGLENAWHGALAYDIAAHLQV